MEDALQLSDKEIIDFLLGYWRISELRLSGFYNGTKITSIKADGRSVKYPFRDDYITFKYFNVFNLEVGKRYSFEVELAPREFRERVNQLFIVNPVPGTFVETVESNPRFSSPKKLVPESIRNLLSLENDIFIGHFHPDYKSGQWIISDIRNHEFTKVENRERGIKNLEIIISASRLQSYDIRKNGYHRFHWTLVSENPLQFDINTSLPIDSLSPRQIVKCIYDGILGYPLGAVRKIENNLETLEKQLTQSGNKVFIYELLQNANDYPKRDYSGNPMMVDVEFLLTKEFLIFQHTGDFFNPRNIAAICDINDGEKKDNVSAIGYKGIGFKTVFRYNNFVFLRTGAYSFCFDYDSGNRLWKIIPIWKTEREISPEIDYIFSEQPNNEYRVKFALKPSNPALIEEPDDEDSYASILSEVFSSARLILFIPNIRSVTVSFPNLNRSQIVINKEDSKWCVSKGLIGQVDEAITKKVNTAIENRNAADATKGYDKVPEKYLNFVKTEVKFACKRELNRLEPVDDARLYCYLPAKYADWGFKFLMNTDMVPNGPRDNIEDIELNHEITRIAGQQFFKWIQTLIKENKYDLDSIFSLIPDFNECKRAHSNESKFIAEFQNSFESLCKTEDFIPAIDKEGNIVYTTIDKLLFDFEGLTTQCEMPDSDFIYLTGCTSKFLPIHKLRESRCFRSFFSRYCSSSYKYDFDKIKGWLDKTRFTDWLSKTSNNHRFLSLIAEKKKFSDFRYSPIFIEYEGELFQADNLFFDFDAHFSGLECLRCYIPHLSPDSKTFLASDERWTQYIEDWFKDFDAQDAIEEYILDSRVKAKTLKLLENLENSRSFYSYVAQNDVDLSNYTDELPFVNYLNTLEYGFDSTVVYFHSDEAELIVRKNWIAPNTVSLLSPLYFSETPQDDILKKCFIGYGVSIFSNVNFIENVVLGNDEVKNSINELIDGNFTINNDFLKYVYLNKDCLKEKEGRFRDFVLLCEDIEGEEYYLNNDDTRFFDKLSESGSSTYRATKGYSFLSTDMMYSLSSSYFTSCSKEEAADLESFIRQVFLVKTFTQKSFYQDVVLKKRKEIIRQLDSKENLLSFISYLERDSLYIFDDHFAYNDLKGFPILLADDSIKSIPEDNTRCYTYDEDAVKLLEEAWCPSGLYFVLHSEYTSRLSTKALTLLRFSSFDMASAMSELILVDKSFQTSMASNLLNMKFWQWLKANQKGFADMSIFKEVKMIDSSNHGFAPCSCLYISDAYQSNGIESLVRKYDFQAAFVSSIYLEDNEEATKEEWVRFFKKVGLRHDSKDILFNSVIPNIHKLGDAEMPAVLSMLSSNQKDVFAKWDSVKDQVKKLKVKTVSGSYNTLDKVIVVSIPDDQEKTEPFAYITIGDEIAQDEAEGHGEMLLKIANEFSNNSIIKDRISWASEKIKEYAVTIQKDASKRDLIHVAFIRELASFAKSYTIDSGVLSTLQFKDKSGSYRLSSDLTRGKAYSPLCEFEAQGITSLSYITEEYFTADNKDLILSFFRSTIQVHSSFEKSDIPLLKHRGFAVYFWREYFPVYSAVIEPWIKDGAFNDVECIPTGSAVKAPESLYSPEIHSFVEPCPDFREKMPLNDVVISIAKGREYEVFKGLHFKNKLDFEDCLYYLLNARDNRLSESDNRYQVLSWILESTEIDETAIDTYREQENALWRNGKSRLTHISKLYMIHPDARQARHFFSGDDNVFQVTPFPREKDSLEKVCKILKIKVLTARDFTSTPINAVNQTRQMMSILKPKLLILAGIESEKSFEKVYNRYISTLSEYQMMVCDKIEYGYGDINSDVFRVVQDEHQINYVESWSNRRTFSKFCSRLRSILNIELETEIFEDVMDEDSDNEIILDKYCMHLAYNPAFQVLWEAANGATIEVEAEEEEPSSPNDSYYKDALSKKGLAQEQTSTSPIGESTPIATNSNSERVSSPGNESSSQVAVSSEPSAATAGVEVVGTQDVEVIDVDLNNEETDDDSTDSFFDSVSPAPHHTPSQSKMKSDNPKEKENSDLSSPLSTRTRSTTSNRRQPKQYTEEDIARLKSTGVIKVLKTSNIDSIELSQLNHLLGTEMSAEEIADTNYLANLRLYQSLVEEGYQPKESLADFVRSNSSKHEMVSGKFIHPCSAAHGIVYISPKIWNLLTEGKCDICVYAGKRANEFFYIRSKEELLKWVSEDDILIKLTGNEKVQAVDELYSTILKDTKGTAYTLLRIASNEVYNPVFAPLMAEEEGNDNQDEL